MGAAARSASAFFQPVDQIGARALQRRINSHRNAGQDRQRDREKKHRQRKLETCCRIEREKVRRHFRNNRDQLPGQQRTDRTGDCADRYAFEDKQTNDAAARSADRHSQRDFPATSGETNEQEIRHVAASDQQNKRNGGEKRPKCGPQISRHILRQRL